MEYMALQSDCRLASCFAIGTKSKYISFDVINDVTTVRRSCCLHSFGIFCEDKMSLF